MAHKKAGGSTRNGRDSNPKFLGVKKYDYINDPDKIKTVAEDKFLYEQVAKKSDNAIDEIKEFTEIIIDKLKDVNPSLMYDMEKYHPKAYEIFQNHKRVEVYQSIKDNLDNGIKEGLYRKSLNTDIIAKLFSEKIEILFNVELFPQKIYTFREMYQEMISYHLKGVVSEKGYNYLIKNKLKQN